MVFSAEKCACVYEKNDFLFSMALHRPIMASSTQSGAVVTDHDAVLGYSEMEVDDRTMQKSSWWEVAAMVTAIGTFISGLSVFDLSPQIGLQHASPVSYPRPPLCGAGHSQPTRRVSQ